MGSLIRGAWNLLGRGPRKTIIWTFATFSAAMGSAFYWNAEFFAFLLAPADGQLSPFDGKPIFTSPIDMFAATIALSFKVGVVVALPVFVVGLLGAVRPLLSRRPWWSLTGSVVLVTGFALAGSSFVYYVLVPVALGFLLNFGGDVAVPVITLNEYMDLLTSLTLWISLIFELPPAMFLLAKIRLVSYQRARRVRKWVPWVSLIFAALITPSLEGFLTFLVAGPMYLLYEVGLFAAWLAHPEDGNYLWVKTVRRWIRKVRDGIAWDIRKVRNGIAWVVRRPARGICWLFRKAHYWMWNYWAGG